MCTITMMETIALNTLPVHWHPHRGGGNSEQQCYTDRSSNIKVENGRLILEAVRGEYKGVPESQVGASAGWIWIAQFCWVNVAVLLGKIGLGDCTAYVAALVGRQARPTVANPYEPPLLQASRTHIASARLHTHSNNYQGLGHIDGFRPQQTTSCAAEGADICIGCLAPLTAVTANALSTHWLESCGPQGPEDIPDKAQEWRCDAPLGPIDTPV